MDYLHLELLERLYRRLPRLQILLAETRAERMRGSPAFPRGFEITYRPHRLKDPLRIKQPALMFVNSMSDYFDPQEPDDWRDRLLDVMRVTPHLQYQILTKRPRIMLDYCDHYEMPDNAWPGDSVELPLSRSHRVAAPHSPRRPAVRHLRADVGRPRRLEPHPDFPGHCRW
jgi:protein gp37